MNDWQTARQMKSLLGDRTWPDGDNETVVGDAIITPYQPEALLGNVRDPFVSINIGIGTADATQGDLIRQRFTLNIVQENSGDETGEALIIGANRIGGGQSENRGLLEIKEQVMAVLGFNSAANGLPRFQLIKQSSAIPTIVDSTRYALQTITVETTCTRDRTFPAPAQFQAADATGGDASLTWKNPPTRYDFYRVHIRRASGSTAPATVSDGTQVYTGTDESYTDSPGAGEYSYAIFAEYDESATYDGGTAATAEQQSDQETGTTDTETIT